MACRSNGHGYEDGGPEEWDEYAMELVDSGEPGLPVTAIYDYQGVEADELTFKAGGWRSQALREACGGTLSLCVLLRRNCSYYSARIIKREVPVI